MKMLKGLFGSRKLAPLLGLSFALAWVYAPMMLGELFYLVYHLAFGATLVGLALAVRAKPSLVAPRHEARVSLAAVCAMCFAPFALLLLGTDYGLLPTMAFGALSGAGSAWLLSAWFQVYCRYRTELAVSYTLLSFSASAALRFALVPLAAFSAAGLVAALCLLPFASLYLLRRCPIASGESPFALRKTYDVAAPASERPLFSGTAAFFVEIIVYGLVFGVLRNGMLEWSNAAASLYMGHLFRIFLPLLLLAWFSVPPNDERRERAVRGLLLAGAFLVVVAVFFGDSPTVVISSLTLAARNFVTIILYMMLYRTVRDFEAHPLFVYGVGRGVYELALTGGLVLFSATAVSEFVAAMSINSFYFVIACICLLLFSSFGHMSASIRRASQAESVVRDLSLDDRLAEVARSYRLSEREEEVMGLLCRGRTKRYIAETLYLSEDTVRWHAKQLYRKLDVHSKQELIDLIGAANGDVHQG